MALVPYTTSVTISTAQNSDVVTSSTTIHTLTTIAPIPAAQPNSDTSSTSSTSSCSGPSGTSSAAYTAYTGHGYASEGWPQACQWLSFQDLWTANQNIMAGGCSQWSQPANSPEEILGIQAAIQAEANALNYDVRFLFAIMMEESSGCVRVWNTTGVVNNPGLFQSHNGPGSCHQQPALPSCPFSEIVQMVRDGVDGPYGTSGGSRIIPIHRIPWSPADV